VAKPVWLTSITAVPSESFKPDFLEPEQVDARAEFVRKCGQMHFNVEIDNGKKNYCYSCLDI